MNKIVPFLLIFFFISGTFTVACNPVSASELVEDSWNTKTPMTQARAGLGVVAVDGKIYAIGGSTADGNWQTNKFESGFVGTNECYDPVTDTWITLQDMPTPRSNFAIAAYQDKIYCIGGITGWTILDNYPFSQHILCTTVEVYDTVSDTWSTKTPFMSHNAHISADLSASIVDGKVFVINQYWLCMYDPNTDTWTDKAKLPLSHGYYSAEYAPVSVVMDGKIVVTSEISDPDFRGALFYDPKTDTWSKSKIRCRVPHFGDAGATTGLYAPQKIYVLGILKECGDNLVYDPLNDSWSDGKSMLTPRFGFGVAVVADVLYAIGGCTMEQAASAVNEQYVPISYHGTLPPVISPFTTPTPSNSITSSEPEPTKSLSTYIIVAVFAIIIGTVTGCVVVYFKKRNRKGGAM